MQWKRKAKALHVSAKKAVETQRKGSVLTGLPCGLSSALSQLVAFDFATAVSNFSLPFLCTFAAIPLCFCCLSLVLPLPFNRAFTACPFLSSGFLLLDFDFLIFKVVYDSALAVRPVCPTDVPHRWHAAANRGRAAVRPPRLHARHLPVRHCLCLDLSLCFLDLPLP